MKLQKRKKTSRLRGSRTAFYGARKKHKGKGNKGGKGMSGTGKRADHRKTLILNLKKGVYFGKQGITSKKTAKKRNKVMNIDDIEKNLVSFEKNKIAKKTTRGWELNLADYKILSRGETKNKLIINAKSTSENAREKIEKTGGKIIVKVIKQKKEEKLAKEDKEEKKKREEKRQKR